MAMVRVFPRSDVSVSIPPDEDGYLAMHFDGAFMFFLDRGDAGAIWPVLKHYAETGVLP